MTRFPSAIAPIGAAYVEHSVYISSAAIANGGGTAAKAPAKPKVMPGQADLFDRRRTLAAHAKVTGDLPLPEAVLAQLDEGERATLGVLMQNGSAKATELAKVQQRSAARVNGYMTQLKRKLHKLDVECFDVERLPSGESQYTWTGGKA